MFDYDAAGRVAMKRLRPTGSAQAWQVDIAYRADGQPTSITYPDGGGGRLVQPFEYDVRGNVLRVPGIVTRSPTILAAGGLRLRTEMARRRASPGIQ